MKIRRKRFADSEGRLFAENRLFRTYTVNHDPDSSGIYSPIAELPIRFCIHGPTVIGVKNLRRLPDSTFS